MVGVPQVETSQFILGLGVYIQTLHWSVLTKLYQSSPTQNAPLVY